MEMHTYWLSGAHQHNERRDERVLLFDI